MRVCAIRTIVGFSWVAAAAAAAQQITPGYQAASLPVAAPGDLVGGFEVLPNGNYALFVNGGVVEVDKDDGSGVQILFIPPTRPQFGAFLRIDPTGGTLYFGESHFGDVWAIDLATRDGAVLTNVVFPYDMDFDSAGRAYLAWSAGFGLGSQVSVVDLASGALSDVLVSAEASGPVRCAADDGLWYARPDTSSFPPPPQSTVIYRFTKSELEAALKSGPWTDTDGEVVAALDIAYGLARDASGDLFATDWLNDRIYEVDAETGAVTTLLDDQGSFVSFSYVRHVAETRGAFERHQPETGGSLLAFHTDFFSFNEVVAVRPLRPALAVEPASPVPAGPFQFRVEDGAPFGVALAMLGAGVLADEIELGNRSWPAPLFFGLDVSAGLLFVALALDGEGDVRVDAINPGLGGASLGVQCVIGAGASGSLYGTSAPLEIVFE